MVAIITRRLHKVIGSPLRLRHQHQIFLFYLVKGKVNVTLRRYNAKVVHESIPRSTKKMREIFSIHYFFAEGKKVKGMVRNDGFWGWGR